MNRYSIKNLEELGDVKAHTIRIWEQRYGLLKPDRTDTNIRYYDDNDLKKFLNVCLLLKNGGKISKLSRMSEKDIADKIDLLIAASDKHLQASEAFINQLLIAVSSYDELLFDKTFKTAVTHLGLKNTYLKVIYPMLVKVGLLWCKNNIMPAQEHFLSNLIQKKLFAAIDSLPLKSNSQECWLLFLYQQEDHEIGLLFANYLLRQMGLKVIYLGARVPFENLEAVIRDCRPTHALTFFVRHHPQIKNLLADTKKQFKQLKLYASGNNDVLNEKVLPNGVIKINSPNELLEAAVK